MLEISKPGDIFGEISLLDEGPRTAWVYGRSVDVEVLRLDREHFEDYVREYTPAALNLLSVAARRLRKSDEVIRRTVTRNANDVTAEQQTFLTRIADAGSFRHRQPALGLSYTPHSSAVWIAINLSLFAGSQDLRSLSVRPVVGHRVARGDYSNAVRFDQPKPAARARADSLRYRV